MWFPCDVARDVRGPTEDADGVEGCVPPRARSRTATPHAQHRSRATARPTSRGGAHTCTEKARSAAWWHTSATVGTSSPTVQTARTGGQRRSAPACAARSSSSPPSRPPERARRRCATSSTGSPSSSRRTATVAQLADPARLHLLGPVRRPRPHAGPRRRPALRRGPRPRPRDGGPRRHAEPAGAHLRHALTFLPDGGLDRGAPGETTWDRTAGSSTSGRRPGLLRRPGSPAPRSRPDEGELGGSP